MIIYWIVYLVVFLGIGFVVGETIALATGGITLSRFVWMVSAAFPPFGFFMGFIAGFLACHFWWGGAVAFEPLVKATKYMLGR